METESTLSAEEREHQEQIVILDKTRRKIKTQIIIIENVFWAIWTGAIPVPFIDMVFMTAVQLKMVSQLSLEYNIKFSKNRSKTIIAGLTAGLSTGIFTTHFIKGIWGIGTITGGVVLATFGGATTYAIGQVFVRHFESGGTLLDLNPTQFKDYFAEQLQEGEKVARRTQADKKN